MPKEILVIIVSFGGIVLGMATAVLIVHILHFVLPRRFDPVLMQSRYFDIDPWFFGVLAFTTWPASTLKTWIYITLIVCPNRFRRRFGNALEDPELKVGALIKGLSMTAILGLLMSMASFALLTGWYAWTIWLKYSAQ